MWQIYKLSININKPVSQVSHILYSSHCFLSVSPPLSLCTASTQMLPAVGSPRRCQATVELQLGFPTSSAQEAAPLPHPALLWCGDAPGVEVSDEEEGNWEEECVRNISISSYCRVPDNCTPFSAQWKINALKQKVPTTTTDYTSTACTAYID